MKIIVKILTVTLFLSLTTVKSEDLKIRSFNQEKLTELRDEYPYDQKIRPSKSESNVNRNNNNGTRSNRPRRTNSDTSGSGASLSGGGVVIYILFGAAIIGLALLILSSKSGGLVWNKSIKKVKDDNSEEEYIDIHTADISRITDQAIANGDYRKAIRLMYLGLLKKLSSKKLINWEENKTNRDYYYEIKNKAIRKDFEETTYMYEYSWYGDIEVQKNQFEFVQNSFNKLLKKLN